ncbi:MAG: peptidyl-alpha-hydroxyglycine alpha-amidating lyase family protein [Candidatus Hydrogenedentes bacterium]|nr:peptidyl-alpha-hydroxyglycine alpha-amidating lyase family protein [Candidatus Hydrogenedentota bacterium]
MNFRIFALTLCSLAVVCSAFAAYPKTNLAPGYEVDPAWPKKPADFAWYVVTGVAVDKQDRVWIFNTSKNDPAVQVYDATTGNYLFGWGAGMFKNPHFIRIDAEGNVWCADYGRHVIRKFSETGKLLLTLGTVDMPGRDETHLNMPTDMAITPNGDVFVTDGYGNNRIVHYDKHGRFIKSWGQLGVGAGDLSQPHAIAMDSKGLLYVCERNNCRIQVFDQDGKSMAQWRNLINPWGITIIPNDEIIVSGSTPARWSERGNLGNPPHDQIVMKFDATGRALEQWAFPLCADGNWKPGMTAWAHGTAVDSKGNLYISDVADDDKEHRVQKFTRLKTEE